MFLTEHGHSTVTEVFSNRPALVTGPKLLSLPDDAVLSSIALRLNIHIQPSFLPLHHAIPICGIDNALPSLQPSQMTAFLRHSSCSNINGVLYDIEAKALGRIPRSMDVCVVTQWSRAKSIGQGTGILTVGLAACIFVGFAACERTPDQTSEAKKAVVADRPGVLHLTSEELARTVIEVAPVAQGELRVPREFPATVQANANQLAEVTALIRGRVVKVHVDVGQDVKKDALLAMLHSTDLGVAEGAYLKAAAKLYEAKLAYERARGLNEQKVMLTRAPRRRLARRRSRCGTRRRY